MSRVWTIPAYLVWLVLEIVKGSWQVMLNAVTPQRRSRPAIVEMPLRCCTDTEVTAMTSSITITPGTLVLGVAAATDELPVTIFVHCLWADSRAEVLADLRDMEDRLLRALRGREDAA